MFVDTSVIVAIIQQEEGWEAYATALRQARTIYVSPLCRWEAVRALLKVRTVSLEAAQQSVDQFFEIIHARMINISSDIGKIAEQAAATYGMARHPAALNFGDCFSYACAKAYHVPLLYKGNDFSQTDLA